ncbi:MAG TPA: anthranilate phosphoribosyltransferase [Gammaproteobacteria bacterium]|nr:anthranilate phosphoribosyltransferase [Gammaproteobacteria bacterium]
MTIQEAIKAVIARRDLSGDEMTSIMRAIMTGQATPAQIGGFLVGLRMKGETVEEVAAAAGVMRELSTRVQVPQAHLVDTCGTGGDGSGIFNVSTAAAIVAAAAGAKVAKHGNRSVTSKSGSADVLEAAGIKIGITPEQVAQCISECGVGFMFAPAHHGAMKHAIGPRREMAVRTIFNVLGPLTNPAGAPNQVLGVFDRHLLEPMAQVLQRLGSRHVMVVHAADGLDEISIADKTDIAELKDGRINVYAVTPEELGCSRSKLDMLKVLDAAASLNMIRRVFDAEKGPALDIVALNAGAAIYVSGVADSLQDGIEKARKVIADGAAKATLAKLIAVASAF